jgi:hypothetical protein
MRCTVPARNFLVLVALICAFSAGAAPCHGQSAKSSADQKTDLETVAKLLQQLQTEVQALHSEVNDLKAQQASATAESEQLRKQLEAATSRLAAMDASAKPPAETAAATTAVEERVSRLEENQQLTDSRLAEHSQSKVESSSKYRLRLSGMAVLNFFGNRGNVDNSDFPQLAVAPDLLSSKSTFGGSIRQSQIGLQAFGPTVAGAHTSADVELDFAGGFPDVPNGASFGLMRLRTGTVRFDWERTSVIAGQDALFFSPLNPTSISTLATPALAYSGNLWGWTPQVRVEHKFTLSDSSSFSVQGGILDALSGDKPFSMYYRSQSWAESSGQPGYAARVAWSRSMREDQVLSFGAGGYYDRQRWGFGRSLDAWAATLDARIPLGSKVEFTGQFYRGRAIGGFGAGLGQTAVWSGSLINPATDVYGLDSMGGWTQLKYRLNPKLQFNAAFGIDNPFAGELRDGRGNTTYYSFPLSKNEGGFVNFIYQPRSNIVFSMEFRRIKTFTLDSTANTANVSNVSVGYIF